MTAAPFNVWLCDLTYTQQTVASDIMPAAVGSIATYAEQELGDAIDVRIFKFPTSLAEALASDVPPRVIGFSNYAWNRDLCTQFAAVIKRKLPDIITVFGGPNYPTIAVEQEAFLRSHPMIDLYVVKEGEAAFTGLIKSLIEVDCDLDQLPDDLPSVHRIKSDNGFHAAQTEDRLLDLSLIPSPYLTGKMDEFFDGVMLPIIQTNRGCPFKCTFCVEGQPYYSRVAKAKQERTKAELLYISERMSKLRADSKGRSDLHIADSNFGMYKEDLLTCEAIAEMQKTYDYPEYINVATGKNHKKRVLEAARMINGALRLSGSVQSLDLDVLENIQRSNINEQEIMELALEATEIGANVYSEIILGLPGDSLKAHFDTIRTVIDGAFNTVCLYQLMLLPGTDLAARESVEKWHMKTRYRALPRCYGYFDCLGEEINAAEIEEICVQNNSLSFDDYLHCRRFHLMINVFYNDGVFKDVLKLISLCGLSKYDWIEYLYNYDKNERFNGLVQEFLDETQSELWEDRDAFVSFVRDRDNIKRYIDGEFGANLIFKYRSIALSSYTDDLAEIAKVVTRQFLEDNGKVAVVELSNELIEYSYLRMRGIFSDRDETFTTTFNYAVDEFSDDTPPNPIETYRFDAPVVFDFAHSEEQQNTIADFLSVYGTSVAGMSRILAKVYVRRLFRNSARRGVTSHVSGHDESSILHESVSTGLNQFT